MDNLEEMDRFLEKSNLPWLNEEEIEIMNKIRNGEGKVTKDNAEIQRMIRDYYKQLHGNKIDNLEEIDRFLEKFNFW